MVNGQSAETRKVTEQGLPMVNNRHFLAEIALGLEDDRAAKNGCGDLDIFD